MSERMSLEGILSGEKPAPAEKPKEELKIPVLGETLEIPPEPDKQETNRSLRKEAQKREYAAQGRDADGRFISKEEPKPEEAKAPPKAEEKPKEDVKAASPTQEEMTPKEKAAFTKAADETRKRQALELKIKEMEARAAAPPAPTEGPKPFWEDPEGHFARLRNENRQMAINTRLQTSEMIARQRHEDFDEKIAIFQALVEANPGLIQPLLQSIDPAEHAYKLAANHKAVTDAGGVDKLIEKARAEERVKVAAELKEKADKAAAEAARERAALPGSLSDTKGTSGTKAVWAGPTSLEDILKSK